MIDPGSFRRVLAHFCSGIVAVTALERGAPIGLTCQSFSALSLDPPLVMFAPAKSSTSWPRVRNTGQFVVNILGAGQENVSRAFAISGADKFAGVAWTPGLTGAPRLAGALAHIECAVHEVHDGGDHEIAVGRVIALDAQGENSEPLLYFRSSYRRLPAAAPHP